MAELTAKQKLLQLGLGISIGLGVGVGLHLLGAKAAWLGAVAAGMWAMPYIELRTTGRQPKDLTVRQLAALGTSMAFVLIEATRWV